VVVGWIPTWALAALLTACAAESNEVEPMKITVSSNSFGAGAPIPRRYAYRGEGQNVSPSVHWAGVPKEAKELALVCDDPDAPTPEPQGAQGSWVHWVVYGIQAGASGLMEGDVVGAREGVNSWGESGWGGPMPPKGHGTHHYHFKVCALDTKLGLPAGATKAEVVAAMRGHVLAEGELVGTYKR
jgi:hypothetical protein